MKVIFLDVDGVLNNYNTRGHAPSGFLGVSNPLIRNLATIVSATDAKIVLISDWRLIKGDKVHNKDYNYLVRKLRTVGELEVYGHTEDISWPKRGDEVKLYLDSHSGIEEYVIIDDCPFRSFERCHLETHFVLTDPYKGLTKEDAEIAISVLNGELVESPFKKREG